MNTDPKNQPIQPQVSVPVGGSEGMPTRVETAVQNVENYVKPSNADLEPEIHPDVANAGVKVVPNQPKIPDDAKNAGVKPSIPGPNYNISPVDIKIGEEIVSKSDTANANAWRTLLSVFKEKKDRFISLFKPKPIQQNPI